MNSGQRAAYAAALWLAAGSSAGGAQQPFVVDHRQTPIPSTRWTSSADATACAKNYGAESADLPEGLFNVTSATRLSNGAVVAFTRGLMKLVYFDAAGKVLALGGGRGGGPGEFSTQSAWVLPYRGDSVLAYGLFATNVAIFTPNGRYARTQPLQRAEAGEPAGSIMGYTADGAVVTMRRIGRRATTGLLSYRDSITVFWFAADGKERATTGRIEDVFGSQVPITRENVNAKPTPGGGWSYTIPTAIPNTVSRFDGFSGRTVAANGGAVYHFEEVNDALVVYGPDGRQVRRILIRPLRPEHRTNTDNAQINQSQILELRADRLGRAWVEVERESLDAPRKWWVFDAQGRWIAEARTPPRTVNMLELGPDYILVLKTDADGLQTIAYCPMK